ncbi:DUF489 family protein [Enterobacter cloacae subsp. cloacae]|nr:DUF489 family protein [Enterobacter cloacae subsp. cloacae]
MQAAVEIKRRALTRYTLSLMVLERKLSAASALNTLGDRIAGLQRQLNHFDLRSETLLTPWPVFVDVISPLGPRIEVTGSPAGHCEARRFRQKYAPRCWPGIRAAVLASGWRWPPAVNVFS